MLWYLLSGERNTSGRVGLVSAQELLKTEGALPPPKLPALQRVGRMRFAWEDHHLPAVVLAGSQAQTKAVSGILNLARLAWVDNFWWDVRKVVAGLDREPCEGRAGLEVAQVSCLQGTLTTLKTIFCDNFCKWKIMTNLNHCNFVLVKICSFFRFAEIEAKIGVYLPPQVVHIQRQVHHVPDCKLLRPRNASFAPYQQDWGHRWGCRPHPQQSIKFEILWPLWIQNFSLKWPQIGGKNLGRSLWWGHLC